MRLNNKNIKPITPALLVFQVLLFSCKGEIQSKNEKPTTRPNIILILADDMGFSDLGSYGGEIRTPNLDELAKNGVRFSQFYNAARCCPSRASLLTGLYPVETGIGWMVHDLGYPGYEGYLNNECVTIAEALKVEGYQTYMSGKWHLGEQDFSHPNTRGFDQFYGTLDGAGSYYEPSSLSINRNKIKVDTTGYYYTDAISNAATDFLKEQFNSKEDTPFFMYVAYTAPHWPLHAPEEEIEKYKGFYSSGWDTIRKQRFQRMIEMGIIDDDWQMTSRDDKVIPWDEAPNKEWRERCMEVYAAQVSIMDEGIGRILDTLKKNGEFENTLVMFLSDNGGCSTELYNYSWMQIPETTVGGKTMRPGSNPEIIPGDEDTYAAYGLPWANVSNTPFREYKIFSHEGGIATPFIAHYPNGIQQSNKIIHQPAHIVDVMATCLDVAGAEYPTVHNGIDIKPTRGKSLIPASNGKETPIHEETLFWEHTGKRAARNGRWKIVSMPKKDWELYDMQTDRTENNDLSQKHPEILERLVMEYESWAIKNGVLSFEKWYEARHNNKESDR